MPYSSLLAGLVDDWQSCIFEISRCSVCRMQRLLSVLFPFFFFFSFPLLPKNLSSLLYLNDYLRWCPFYSHGDPSSLSMPRCRMITTVSRVSHLIKTPTYITTIRFIYAGIYRVSSLYSTRISCYFFAYGRTSIVRSSWYSWMLSCAKSGRTHCAAACNHVNLSRKFVLSYVSSRRSFFEK